MRSAILNGVLLGFRCPYLCHCLRGLSSGVRVLKLQQKLALFNVLSFMDKNTLNTGIGQRPRLEVRNRLHLAVGGNLAADRSPFHGSSSHRQYAFSAREIPSRSNGQGRQHQPLPHTICVVSL